MDQQERTPEVREVAESEHVPSRRRFTSAGVVGAGVLASVASRSALGGWGTCTGSELASGNLSRQGQPNPCGCSPGFWWNINGSALWDSSPALAAYGKHLKFNDVFGREFFKPSMNVTLWQCKDVGVDKIKVSCTQNSMPAVAFHAVAALLNAAYYGNRYPVLGMQSPGGVIAAFQTAFGVNGDCNSLIAFKDRVDIYGKTPDLWCNGSRE